MIPATPAAFLAAAAPGTRVVVRYRIEGGFTDVLGELRAVDADSCTVGTRRGDVVVSLSAVAAAKQVPPAPPRRRPRAGGQSS